MNEAEREKAMLAYKEAAVVSHVAQHKQDLLAAGETASAAAAILSAAAAANR